MRREDLEGIVGRAHRIRVKVGRVPGQTRSRHGG
jgi:hypothetical protein